MQIARKALLFIFIFLLSLQIITDTDFGWHLRVGENIINTKSIPKTDIFSFTNPNYPYVYHSWGTEVLIYLSYRILGFKGVTILYAGALTISIFILYKISVLFTKKPLNPLFLFGLAPIAYSVAGGRTRVFGLLFLCLIYYLFLKYKHNNSKLVYYIPGIFFLWVNFHGSFILGIFTLFILLAVDFFFSNKEKVQKISFVLPLSILATLVNPYFLNSWRQAIAMTINSYGINKINLDWQPLINPNNSGWILAILAASFFAAAFMFKAKIDSSSKILFLLSLALSLISSRFSILLLVFFTPIAAQTVSIIKTKVKREILNALPVKASITAFTAIIMLLVLINLIGISYAYKSPKSYSEYLKLQSQNLEIYPPWGYRGSEFIKMNLNGKRVLTEANWGNFMLIYQKDLKLFYYGAMDNFIINGKSFALTYLKVVHAQKGFENELEKYNVEVVFLPNNYPLIKKLEENPRWQKVYKDEYAEILTKI